MSSRVIPDITSDTSSSLHSTIRWVGMDGIAIPLNIALANATQTVAASSDIYVSLDDRSAKGIHMSRLYSCINDFAVKEYSKESIESLLEDMISSQQGLSKSARISIDFSLTLEKPALLSGRSGFQAYSISLISEKNEQDFTHQMQLAIPYSSTCPCSTSLSQQLTAEAVDSVFSEPLIEKARLLTWLQGPDGAIATPHSQRSFAYIHLTLNEQAWPCPDTLIWALEDVLATPVQTAVKRIDEQEFARLNAANQMFCEDAARKLQMSLSAMDYVNKFWCKVEHQESLHAHNAVAVVTSD